MKPHIVIGIDTGGTYTDAVAFDLRNRTVLAKGKARTTKEDLSCGISNAMDTLPPELLRAARRIALSTTLATNACVEGKGGRAKLILMGTTRAVMRRIDAERVYGLRDEDVLCLDTHGSFDGSVVDEPDWNAVIAENEDWLADAEALGVVEANAARNGAVCERHAKEVLAARFGVPVIMASELASDLNMMERGATALLNARLLPVIEDFLSSVRRSLEQRGIDAPVFVVRSDGSLMDEAFARQHPVETILSGPAASILGARELAKSPDCVIVDMGGTTSDVSLVADGEPALTDRIRIGSWKTQVKGAFVETFGLGGDTAVRIEGGRCALATRRVEPVSAAAQRWPEFKEALARRASSPCVGGPAPCEGLYLVREPADPARYTAAERDIVADLRCGPALIGDGIKVDRYVRTTERLEAEGVVMRFGFTPTDAMHLAGHFNRYDGEVALLAARILGKALGIAGNEPEQQIAADVYRLVEHALYLNLARILIARRYPRAADDAAAGAFDALIEENWRRALAGADSTLFDLDFALRAAVVGVGAPSHLLVPETARLLGARCVIPGNSEVANAVGAATAAVSARGRATVVPQYDAFGIVGYTVTFDGGRAHAASEDEALEKATEAAHDEAMRRARQRGAHGKLSCTVSCAKRTSHDLSGQTLHLETAVTATASACDADGVGDEDDES